MHKGDGTTGSMTTLLSLNRGIGVRREVGEEDQGGHTSGGGHSYNKHYCIRIEALLHMVMVLSSTSCRHDVLCLTSRPLALSGGTSPSLDGHIDDHRVTPILVYGPSAYTDGAMQPQALVVACHVRLVVQRRWLVGVVSGKRNQFNAMDTLQPPHLSTSSSS